MADDQYINTSAGPAFTRRGRVYLEEADGSLLSIEAREMDQAMGTGRYKLATAQQVHDLDRKRKARALSKEEGVTGQIRAFAEGAGRSAIDMATLVPRLAGAEMKTGGEVLSEITGADEEKMRLRAEGNPLAAAAGGLAPDIALTLATGGTGGVLRGGARATARGMLTGGARKAALREGAEQAATALGRAERAAAGLTEKAAKVQLSISEKEAALAALRAEAAGASAPRAARIGQQVTRAEKQLAREVDKLVDLRASSALDDLAAAQGTAARRERAVGKLDKLRSGKEILTDAGKMAAVAGARDTVIGSGVGGLAGGQLEVERAWRTNTPVDSARLTAGISQGALFGGLGGGIGGTMAPLIRQGGQVAGDLVASGGMAARRSAPLFSRAGRALGGSGDALGNITGRAGLSRGVQAVGAGLDVAGRIGPRMATVARPVGRAVGRAGAAFARSAGRPMAYMNAIETDATMMLQNAQEQTAQNLQGAIAHAAQPRGKWKTVSGVGNYRQFPAGQFRYPQESFEDAFFARSQEMAELAANPQSIVERVAANTEGIGQFAPNVSQDLVDTSVRAAQFMARFSRATAKTPDPLRPHDTKAVVDRHSMVRYQRLWEATMFPGKVMDELAEWDLHEETVVALGEVHPHLLRDVRTHVAERLLNSDWKPNYQQRLQLAMLMGTVDRTTRPGFQARLSGYAQQVAAQDTPPPGGGRRGRPTGRPTLNQQYRTASQVSQTTQTGSGAG